MNAGYHRLFSYSYRKCSLIQISAWALRPNFTSKLVPELAFGTPKFYVAPYDKIKHELIKLSSNCDVKSGLRLVRLNTRVRRFNNYVCFKITFSQDSNCQ